MKLRYDAYKLLTEQEKEEYNYKFNSEDDSGLISYIWANVLFKIYILIWVFLGSCFSYFCYIGYKATLIQKEVFFKLFGEVIILGQIFFISVCILYLLDVLFIILDNQTERKWLEKRLYREIINGKKYYKRKEDIEE